MTCLWSALQSRAITVKVFRQASGYYDWQGNWKHRTPEEIEVVAVVQPASAEQMKSLPENRQSSATISLWHQEPLKVLDVAAKQQPDRIEYGSREYEIIQTTDWVRDAGFYVSLASRIEP